MMHQVLIVDDHPHLVDSMAHTLPWEEMGVIGVHKAYSAHEALQTLDIVPVDLVITDIRMPVMSGLELIREIRRRWKDIKIILMSGYADFEYAKEALRQDVEDYLLKPVPNDELIRSIRGVLDKKAAEWQAVISSQRVLNTFREHLPALKTGFLLELLRGRRLPDDLLQEKLDLYELPFSVREKAALVLVRLEEPLAGYDQRSVSLLEYAIANIAEELFRGDFRIWSCLDDYGYLTFLVCPGSGTTDLSEPERQRMLEQCAAHLQHYVGIYLKGSISALVSDWFEFPETVADRYQQCLFAFRQRIGSERSFFMTIGKTEEVQKTAFLSSLYEPPTLKMTIEAGQWNELRGKLDRIFEELLQDEFQFEEHILEVYLEICGMLAYIAHKNRRRLAELIGDEYEKVAGGLPFKTVKPLREWTFRILDRLFELVDRERQHSRAVIVKQVKEYVMDNLGKDVSIQTVANRVFLHPSYLSRIYKSESGESFSDFVLRVRMEKAVALLKNKGIKVYDISGELGYNQTQHFIKMFKKHYGLTPQEYRERLL
ncbi:response regulator [Cohnella herbarum]|uniref:Response regulator n=1 Tax=Cohnella herbarum TaxID=2728023 RepID=A0A7Z2VKB0_9BACL|nr:response regulator [Cohnella herbarum]QJD84662.1 response regulator [Cohnella herbarum]